MLSRLFAFFLLIIGLYLLAIFVVPEFADQYGNRELNAKIRNIKDQSLQFASGGESPASLADKVIHTGQDVIQDTQKTINQVQTTVEQKAEQAKKAAESTQKAYDAVNTATKDIQNLTSLSGTKQ